jgi:hypothetical protein
MARGSRACAECKSDSGLHAAGEDDEPLLPDQGDPDVPDLAMVAEESEPWSNVHDPAPHRSRAQAGKCHSHA